MAKPDLGERSDVKGAIDQLINSISRQTYLREGKYPSIKQVIDQATKLIKARISK